MINCIMKINFPISFYSLNVAAGNLAMGRVAMGRCQSPRATPPGNHGLRSLPESFSVIETA